MRRDHRRYLVWVVQGALAVALVVFVGRALAQNWAEFRALRVDLAVRPGPIALAAITTLLTYALLIEAWRRVLAGWGDRLPYSEAAYIWTVSNLARYIPGKVWTIAGLAALARRAGASAGAATASSLAIQALAVATGAAVTALAVPGTAEIWVLVPAIALALGGVGVLVWEPSAIRVLRLLGGGDDSRPLPLGPVLLAAGATLASWVTHGTAFWLLSRGVLTGAPLELSAAIPAFAAGYILGLLALFAPGGIGVREAVLVAVLTPLVGAGDAVAVAVVSRLFLTVMEVGVAAAAAATRARSKESPRA